MSLSSFVYEEESSVVASASVGNLGSSEILGLIPFWKMPPTRRDVEEEKPVPQAGPVLIYKPVPIPAAEYFAAQKAEVAAATAGPAPKKKSRPPVQPPEMISEWKIGKELSSGFFGKVFRAKHVKNGKDVVIKLERHYRSAERTSLLKEFNIYRSLEPSHLFSKAYWVGEVRENWFGLVLQQHGPSLSSWKNHFQGRLSLKTVLMIAIDMIEAARYLHGCGIIHRDIKPQNIVLGSTNHWGRAYLIDFGLSAFTDSIVQFPEAYYRFAGTIKYASLDAQSVRLPHFTDDLESIGFTLIEVATGGLPWKVYDPLPKREKYGMVKEMKAVISMEDLCKGLPYEFQEYLSYLRGLTREDKIDYDYLSKLFLYLMELNNYTFDYFYDWVNVD